MVVNASLEKSARCLPCADRACVPAWLGFGRRASRDAQDREGRVLEDQREIRFGHQSTRGESPR